MVAPSHPLPDIPPRERHLLTAILELDADLPAVAARTRAPLDDLTRWAHSDAVRAWLDAYHGLAHFARQSREHARTTRTLNELEQLHKTTDNPVEKRRILTAILNASRTILHGRAFPKPLPDGSEVGVGSLDSPTRKSGGSTQTPNHNSSSASPSQMGARAEGWVRATPELDTPHSRNDPASKPLPEGGVGVGSLDSPTPKPGGSTQAAPPKSEIPNPKSEISALPLHLPTTFHSPTPHFNPFPTSHISRSRPRSPAHLLAAAGLPGP